MSRKCRSYIMKAAAFLTCTVVFTAAACGKKESGHHSGIGRRGKADGSVRAFGGPESAGRGKGGECCQRETEIAALNSGESRYSDYMRPGFEFLQEMIDKGYIDAKKAYVSEAIEGEVADFEMLVIGFPSSRGQMPVMPMTGFAVGAEAEDVMTSDEALKVYAETNRVISPSKNVEVECVPALKECFF